METLSDLDLSVNQITKIPNHFFEDMGNLKSLDMSGNQVVEIGRRLSDQLPRLQVLEMSSNLLGASEVCTM